ncbi:MAG: tetraacyldisaccharide 4'-kinase [Hyphomicrobiales bacterium]|nr:tetraacyldisaccharide 4'-kinase [Hyphomicrobiales bacterium]MBV8824349.1 tetraacyldisaccharide 4'-kinase [Hyphomicrobiales bacterium]MBV9428969.1 tetraacyldisaccharide 4'-kinase [Bradyrhizobiaceae bacterium]
MRAPSFWWQEQTIAAALLSPAAGVYGAVAAARLRQTGERAGVPVLCVGNPTLGGSGKTPTALALARLLIDAGKRPFLLSRGYGGRLDGPVRVDPQHHRADDVGDEPLLLARCAPTIIAHDRVAGARFARAAGASAIVLDDGFQNPSLAKDLSLLVIDGRRGVGNDLVFPAGPLRAPLTAQLDRAQALLTIGDGPSAAAVESAAVLRGLSLFRGALVPDAASVAALRSSRVLAFAGIGDPEKFFATLSDAAIDVAIRRGFADHHRFTAVDAKSLLAEADRAGLSLVTTEKDFVRLAHRRALAVLAERSRVLPVALKIDDEDRFRRFVLAPLAAARS